MVPVTASVVSPEADTQATESPTAPTSAPKSRSASLKAYWAKGDNKATHSARMKESWVKSEKNIALAKKRSLPIKDQDGNIYDSVNEAARILSLHASNIRAHLKGRVVHVKGSNFTLVEKP